MTIDQNKIEDILVSDGFIIIRDYASLLVKENTYEDSLKLANMFYHNDDYRIQELGVFIYGYLGTDESLKILKDVVSTNQNWQVQEILAMAFDSYCKINGYKESLIIINEWLEYTSSTRRAVIEGLRIWTSRPYFKDNPDLAIKMISRYRIDSNDYVRKSVGNSLKDISKKYPTLVKEEIGKWDLTIKEEKEVYKLASKNLK